MTVVMLVPQPSHFLIPFEDQNCCPSGDPLGGRLDTYTL